MRVQRIFFYLFFTQLFILSISISSHAQNYNPPNQQAQNNSQRENYFTWGINFGMLGWSPSTTNQISGSDALTRTLNSGVGVVQDISGKKQISISANTSLGLSAGILLHEKKINQFTGIQLEFQSNKACYSFTPPFNFSAQGDTFAGWVMNDKYLKYSLAVQQCWLRHEESMMGGQSYFYMRESFGQTFYHRNFDQYLKAGHFEDWTQNGRGMKATTVSVNQNSFMLSSEIGIRSFSSDNDRTLDLGVVFYAPFANTFTDQYEFFDQNASTGKSDVTYKGSTIMLNLRYTFNYKIKTPARDTIPKVKKQIFVDQPDTAGRKIEVQNTITCKHSTIKVRVWDGDEIDGDSITLILNGQIIKQHIALKRRKKTFKLHLQAGANYLVMDAENLGSVPPNTASIEIQEGKETKKMELSSNMGKSGAIKILRD